MLPAEAKGAAVTQIFAPMNCANNTDGAGGWVAVPATEGSLLFTHSVGVSTGSVTASLETSPHANGANNIAMLFDDGLNFTVISTDNQVENKVVDARKNLGYIKYIGLITTGPSLVSVTCEGKPKTTT